MEHALDDSAIRRMNIPEMFLLADTILIGLDNVRSGLVVYPKCIAARVQEELPSMVTESIIMKLVAKGTIQANGSRADPDSVASSGQRCER